MIIILIIPIFHKYQAALADAEFIPGRALLAAACTVYLGPFGSNVRKVGLLATAVVTLFKGWLGLYFCVFYLVFV